MKRSIALKLAQATWSKRTLCVMINEYTATSEGVAGNQLAKPDAQVSANTKDVIRWMVLYGEAAKDYFAS